MVPVSAEVQETNSDGETIIGWLRGLAPFFQKATALETAALSTLTTAKQLKAPESSPADEVIQKFVQKTTADAKAVEAHWAITGIVFRFHRRLTAKRDIATRALKEANEIGNRLHNAYTAAERRRVEEEERRQREAAEFLARQEREADLARAEQEAIEREAAIPELSEREARFAELFSAGTTLAPDAARIAGYKEWGTMAAKLLALPKIIAAVKAKQEATAIRRQAEARRAMPLDVEPLPEIKPDITRAGSAHDRTTYTAEIIDAKKFVLAALGGEYGIPAIALEPSQSGLNQCARDMGELINRFPGVRLKKVTRVI